MAYSLLMHSAMAKEGEESFISPRDGELGHLPLMRFNLLICKCDSNQKPSDSQPSAPHTEPTNESVIISSDFFLFIHS